MQYLIESTDYFHSNFILKIIGIPSLYMVYNALFGS
jgi:hypothetical protein